MADAGLEVFLTADEVAARVTALADRLRTRLDPRTVIVCLLTGGLWFAADLSRALASFGLPLAFDCLWLASYGDGHESSGRCERLAGPQRSVDGRPVLVVDDVIDSGLSLAEADRLLREAGARSVSAVVFARKPWPERRMREPDDAAWDAPERFLVGYGMDAAGAWRGLPYIAAARDT